MFGRIGYVTPTVCGVQSARLWATSDFVHRSEAFGTTQTARVMLQILPLVGQL